jgi:two-component system cell cycle sensor histidine kinase/response regulator CckA
MRDESAPVAKTLLIVDDDESLVPLLRRMVERLGYRALVASSAAEALTAYRKNRDSIVMVITDLVMSDTDGRTFARDLLAEDPSVRILVSTGMNNSEDMEALRDMGVKGFVFKPYTSRELSEQITEAMAA